MFEAGKVPYFDTCQMLSPHIRSSDKTIRSYQHRTNRAKTPDTASSRILEQAFEHLSPEDRSEYRQLSKMFDSRKVDSTRQSLNLGGDRRPIITQSCDTLSQNAYGAFLTPLKHGSSSSSSNKGSRRSSFDISIQAYYDCDEPELENYPGVQSIQDTITEIVMTPPQFPFRLFISGLKAANDLSLLKESNVRAVMSIGSTNIPGHFGFVQAYFAVPMLESGKDTAHDLYQALGFLEYELNRHNVLVHDFFGVNRSVAVVAALLMKTLSISRYNAIAKVEEARQVTAVSGSMMSCLEAFQLERTSDLQ